jgi:hypothetical protein
VHVISPLLRMPHPRRRRIGVGQPPNPHSEQVSATTAALGVDGVKREWTKPAVAGRAAVVRFGRTTCNAAALVDASSTAASRLSPKQNVSIPFNTHKAIVLPNPIGVWSIQLLSLPVHRQRGPQRAEADQSQSSDSHRRKLQGEVVFFGKSCPIHHRLIQDGSLQTRWRHPPGSRS